MTSDFFFFNLTFPVLFTTITLATNVVQKGCMITEEMKATFDLQGTIEMLKTWAKTRSVHSNGFHQSFNAERRHMSFMYS